MRKIICVIFLIILATCVIDISGLQAEYYYEDLGNLGGLQSWAYGINNSGQVVGGATINGRLDWHAFLKNPGQPMEDLNTLVINSFAYGINNSGQVVGWASFGSLGYQHAFLKNPGQPMEDLGTLECTGWATPISLASSINNSGQVVGWASFGSLGYQHAFLKNPGQPMEDLGTLGGNWSSALSINNSGQVVGWAWTPAPFYYQHAFLKNPGQPMEDLGTLGGQQSSANGINDSGQAVGGANTGSGDVHAFLKNPGQPIEDLGTLGGSNSSAFGINNSGQVVGEAYTGSGDVHAFLKNPGQPMQDLNALTANLPNGVYLTYANAINDAGYIVGQNSNGQAFLLMPQNNIISGVVYKDENADSQYIEKDDISIPGATVKAILNGEVKGISKTDDKGRYSLGVATAAEYQIVVSLPAKGKCFDPTKGRPEDPNNWGVWDTIEMANSVSVVAPAKNVNIRVNYRNLNYGPGPGDQDSLLWELWHNGPVLENQVSVILVHGIQIRKLILHVGDGKVRGKQDHEFGQLDILLQKKQHGLFNVYEFEYADYKQYGRYWTLGKIEDYGERLAKVIQLIRGFVNSPVSIITHSMGGLVSRYAGQKYGGVQKILTMATGHFGFEYTRPGAHLRQVPCLIQMQPGSKFLWYLNNAFDYRNFQLASIAASEDEPHLLPGFVRYSSASLVKCDKDGGVIPPDNPNQIYFTIVNANHGSIKQINSDSNLVFHGIRIFLQKGISDELRGWSPQMNPAQSFAYYGFYPTEPYVTFRLRNPAPWTYPRVSINGRHLVFFGDMYGTKDESDENDRYYAWTLTAEPEESGTIEIKYKKGLPVYGILTKGQSAIIAAKINN